MIRDQFLRGFSFWFIHLRFRGCPLKHTVYGFMRAWLPTWNKKYSVIYGSKNHVSCKMTRVRFSINIQRRLFINSVVVYMNENNMIEINISLHSERRNQSATEFSKNCIFHTHCHVLCFISTYTFIIDVIIIYQKKGNKKQRMIIKLHKREAFVLNLLENPIFFIEERYITRYFIRN